MSMFETKLIGRGSYGYIHSPPLPFVDHVGSGINNEFYISKLMEKKEAEDELEKYKIIQIIDPEKHFHLGLPIIKTPDESAIYQIAKCTKKSYTDVRIRLGKWRLLIMPHGGIHIGKYAGYIEKHDTSIERYCKKTADLWVELFRMIFAISKMIDCGIVHHDIKHHNILYDEEYTRANIIDMTFVNEMDNIKEQTKTKDGYEWNLFFFNLPPELVFYNIEDFECLQNLTYENCELFFNKIYLPDRKFGLPDPIGLPKLERENDEYLNNLFFMIDQDEDLLEELDALYREDENHKTELPIRDYMINQFRQFMFYDVSVYSHEEFLEDSLKTFDIFGLGTALLHILAHLYKFTERTFVIEMYGLIRRMVDTNVRTRIRIEELMVEYFDIIDRHFQVKEILGV